MKKKILLFFIISTLFIFNKCYALTPEYEKLVYEDLKISLTTINDNFSSSRKFTYEQLKKFKYCLVEEQSDNSYYVIYLDQDLTRYDSSRNAIFLPSTNIIICRRVGSQLDFFCNHASDGVTRYFKADKIIYNNYDIKDSNGGIFKPQSPNSIEPNYFISSFGYFLKKNNKNITYAELTDINLSDKNLNIVNDGFTFGIFPNNSKEDVIYKDFSKFKDYNCTYKPSQLKNRFCVFNNSVLLIFKDLNGNVICAENKVINYKDGDILISDTDDLKDKVVDLDNPNKDDVLNSGIISPPSGNNIGEIVDNSKDTFLSIFKSLENIIDLFKIIFNILPNFIWTIIAITLVVCVTLRILGR